MSLGKRGNWRARLALSLLLLTIPLFRLDTMALSPARSLAAGDLFSLEGWEGANFLSKWLARAGLLLSRRSFSEKERLELVQRYFRLGERTRELEVQVERLAALRAGRGSATSPGAGQLPDLEELSRAEAELRELRAERRRMRNVVEVTVEGGLSQVLMEEELGLRFPPLGFLFPPVDLRFDRLPRVLVISPRQKIEVKEVVLLRSDIPLGEIERLESAILQRQGLAALVDNIGGIATYPAIVTDVFPPRVVLRAGAHEWLHHYLFFRPLGQRYGASADLTTLNETLAEMVGREVGDRALVRLSGESQAPGTPTGTSARDPAAFDFNQEMRRTRQQVDELLAHGRVEEAEGYMEARRQVFVRHGFNIRKLNQAYFAFRGTYALDPASVSPVASQLEELRGYYPSLGAFVRVVSSFSSYQAFVEHLEGLRRGRR